MSRRDTSTPDSPGGRGRIAAVVLNSVSHDARVIKEAESLSRAGYQVEIFGIRDNRQSDPETLLDSGVVIRRCDWKYRAHRDASRMYALLGVLALVGLLVPYLLAFTFSEPVVALLTNKTFLFIAGLIPLMLVLIPFIRKAERFSTIAENLKAASKAGDDKAKPSRRRTFSSLLKCLAEYAGSPMEIVRRWVFRRAQSAALTELIESYRPDVVHCHDLNTLPIGVHFKKKYGIPTVYDSHELFEEQSLIGRGAARRAMRAQRVMSRHVDGFVTINDSIARTLKERYPRLPEAVIVKNATALPVSSIVDDGRLRAAAGVGDDRKILLYQGGFSVRRGLDALVRSAVHLPDDWVLVMMGWGTFEDRLRAIASSVDPTGERVSFIPPAPRVELPSWTAGGDLGVIPYENVCLNHWYCSPNKLWEYPVAGVPILASPFPELRAPIERWSIGRLIDDPPSPVGIASAVASISDEELAEMSSNCRRYIEADNWGVYEQRLEGLYSRLLGTGESVPVGKQEDEPAGASLVAAGPVSCGDG